MKFNYQPWSVIRNEKELSVYEYTSSAPYVTNIQSCTAPWIKTRNVYFLKKGYPVVQQDNLCRFRMSASVLNPASAAGPLPIHEDREEWSSSTATLTTSGMCSPSSKNVERFLNTFCLSQPGLPMMRQAPSRGWCSPRPIIPCVVGTLFWVFSVQKPGSLSRSCWRLPAWLLQSCGRSVVRTTRRKIFNWSQQLRSNIDHGL